MDDLARHYKLRYGEKNSGEVSENIKNLIFYAEDLIEELEVEQQEMASSPNASGAVRDTTTSPVVHASMTESSRSQRDSVPKATEHTDAEMEVVVGRENGNVSNEKSSSENDTSMKRASDKSHSDIASSEKAANKKDANNKDGRIIYVYETDKDDKDGVVADRNNTVQIESMLRDSRYKPRAEKATAMPSQPGIQATIPIVGPKKDEQADHTLESSSPVPGSWSLLSGRYGKQVQD
ncbi:hypothetical protein LTR10_019246 [Elasticomyces elasticus]|nr:hypothetical protein LTR10_019246 [Elasticomyces elasticus]KAK5184205.1 hypothetical protein LTR44_003711 [Eurotiomycetes sp. CCFEE 6388]